MSFKGLHRVGVAVCGLDGFTSVSEGGVGEEVTPGGNKGAPTDIPRVTPSTSTVEPAAVSRAVFPTRSDNAIHNPGQTDLARAPQYKIDKGRSLPWGRPPPHETYSQSRFPLHA
jgi:hypothetical protein